MAIEMTTTLEQLPAWPTKCPDRDLCARLHSSNDYCAYCECASEGGQWLRGIDPFLHLWDPVCNSARAPVPLFLFLDGGLAAGVVAADDAAGVAANDAAGVSADNAAAGDPAGGGGVGCNDPVSGSSQGRLSFICGVVVAVSVVSARSIRRNICVAVILLGRARKE
ncbi:uncharacterized protein LOC144101920 isoform X1 [Amblyomma americanum]